MVGVAILIKSTTIQTTMTIAVGIIRAITMGVVGTIRADTTSKETLKGEAP